MRLDNYQKNVMGRVFYDFSKLAFAGLVVGGILSLTDNEKSVMSSAVNIGIGIVVAVILMFIGNRLLKIH